MPAITHDNIVILFFMISITFRSGIFFDAFAQIGLMPKPTNG